MCVYYRKFMLQFYLERQMLKSWLFLPSTSCGIKVKSFPEKFY